MFLALRRLLLLLPLLAVSPARSEEGFGGPGPWMVRARFGDEAAIRSVASWSDHLQIDSTDGSVRVLVDAEQLVRLGELGFLVELDAEGTALLRLAESSQAEWEQAGTIPGFPCYRTVEATYADALSLAAAHPTLATVVDIGDSWDKATEGGPAGYDLLALRLTSSEAPGPKPVLLVNAALHAREYATAEVALRFAEWIVGAYGDDADATWALDAHQIEIVLHANPDGRKLAEGGSSWRKNTDSDDGCATTYGVDLNRNFDFFWNEWDGSSGSACHQNYRGPSPGSEPEVAALAQYMSSRFPDQRPDDLTTPAPDDATGLFVDLHSWGEEIRAAWGQTTSPICDGAPPLWPPNCSQLLRLGRKWAHLSGYDPRVGSPFPVDGSAKDFAFGRLGVPGYTWELGSDFFESCSAFETSVLPAAMAMLRYAVKIPRAPLRLPAGPDAVELSAQPVDVLPGGIVNFAAVIDDTRFSDPDGGEPVEAIQAARAYVDVPPWGVAPVPIQLSATDGVFDDSVEAVEGSLDTTGLASGRHILFIEGEDAGDARGALSALFFRLVEPIFADGFESGDPGEWSGIHP